MGEKCIPFTFDNVQSTYGSNTMYFKKGELNMTISLNSTDKLDTLLS